MAYTPPDKPLSEFTDEEREAFVDELKKRTTPEAWEAMRAIASAVREFQEWTQSEEGQSIRDGLGILREALPILAEEVEKDPKLSGLTLDEIREEKILGDLFARVAARMDADTVAEVSIIARPINTLDFPLDKVNAEVWKLFEGRKKALPGQLQMAIDVGTPEDRKAGKTIDIMYSLNFDELEKQENITLSRKLEPFDKRVYIAISALYDSGQTEITYQQIYNAMGYEGRAGARMLKKIDQAITKMGGARIFVDNLHEQQHYKSRTRFKYDGMLLPMERITASVKGQISQSVIHLFRSLPMTELAKSRGQFTTIDKKLLSSPLNMTSANIQLEDYLIDRIAHMKKGKAQQRMLLATIYEKAGITEKKQRQRAPEKIRKLLEHYKAQGFIAGYSMDEKGVNIELWGTI